MVKQTVLPDFKHPVSNVPIPHDQIPNYLNRYFVDTSERLNNDNSQICFPDVAGLYDIEDFLYLENDLPTSDEILYYVNEIDVNKSSSVLDVNTKYCIEATKAIPDILCGIYCTSITTGIFPSAWSLGTVLLLPKSGNLTDAGNWRPITQTSIFAKLFEKIIYNRLSTHFDTHNIFTEYQYGFLPDKSTQIASFDLLKNVYSSLNNKKLFGVACLDISKTFDCINHELLLHKLCASGLSDKSLIWFTSYLTRSQAVIFYGNLSTDIRTKSGIGQGTILGPILFILYINDIIRNIGGVRINMYADDCVLYFNGNTWECNHSELQQFLAHISTWLTQNALKLSVKKSKCLIISSRYCLRSIIRICR